MSDDVMNAVKLKTDHIRQYFDVDADGMKELEDFENRLAEFASDYSDVAAFETAFAGNALNAEYFAFFTKFTPVHYDMTDADIQTAHDTAVQMLKDDRKNIIREIAEDVVSAGITEAKSRYITERRNEMTENGTIGEYTRATNMADDVKNIARRAVKFFSKK